MGAGVWKILLRKGTARNPLRWMYHDAPLGETVGPGAGFSCEVMLIVIDLCNVLGCKMLNSMDHDENATVCHLVLCWGVGTESTTDGSDEGPLCAGSGIENVIFCHFGLCWGMATETSRDGEGPLPVLNEIVVHQSKIAVGWGGIAARQSDG
jgi:hypothetical protein